MPKFEVMNTNTEEAELAEGFLRECREKGMQPIEGELQKTEEDKQMIAEVNAIIRSESKVFGIELETIEQDSVHFLPAEICKRMGLYETGGAYDPKFGRILLNDELLKDKGRRISAVLHESLHAISHHKFFLCDDGAIENYRVGYQNKPTHQEYQWFEGFNEAVLCVFQNLLLDIHSDELNKKFGFTEEDITHIKKWRSIYEESLWSMIHKIADYKGESLYTTANRFVKGHFTGEMLHLKDIEKVYGPKSLRILAMLDDGHDSRPEQVLLRNMVLKYFSVEDASQREEMTKDIFTQFEVVLRSEEAKKDTTS